MQYQDYNTLASTFIETSTQLTFPEIKLCKFDMIDTSNNAIMLNFPIENATRLIDPMQHYPTMMDVIQMDVILPDYNLVFDFEEIDPMIRTILENTPAKDILKNAFFVPSSPAVKSRDSDEMFIHKNGHTARPFIEECSTGYRGSKYCNISTVSMISYTDQMVCEVFNSKDYINKFGPLISTKPGDKYGLTLKINIDDIDTGMDNGKVFISFGDADITRNTMSIIAREELYIGLQRTSTQLLPDPYSKQDCYTDKEADEYSERHNMVYTRDSCIHRCLENQRYDSCGCTFDTNKPFCILPIYFQPYLYNCTEDETLCTECKPRCNKIAYRTKSSKIQIQEDVMPLRQSIVHIYFSTLNTIVKQQVPAMSLIQLFSNFGGLVSLFVGMSILSVIESIDIMLKGKRNEDSTVKQLEENIQDNQI